MNLRNIITEIYRGTGVQNNQLGTGDYPCITFGEIYTNFKIWTDKYVSYIDTNLVSNKKYCAHGDLITSLYSLTSKKIGKSVAYLCKEKAIAGGLTAVLKHNQNPKYLSYALSTTQANLQKKRLAKIGTATSITTKDLLKIKIPLPPLDIQDQIANKLDKFRNLCEDLTDGLPKEILLSKQKYEYYREKLINR